jgi:hypothetical protein
MRFDDLALEIETAADLRDIRREAVGGGMLHL